VSGVLIPDVNILVHAHNLESRGHDRVRRWGNDNHDSPARSDCPGFHHLVLSVSPLIVDIDKSTRNPGCDPACSRVATPSPSRIMIPGDWQAEILFELLAELVTAGNLTTDAHLAALAIEYQAELVSTDGDFA